MAQAGHAQALNKSVPQRRCTLGGLQSQNHLWGSNPSLCGSVELLSMADVIITPIPYRWTVTVSITLQPQIMLWCRHWQVDLHIHALKALSRFNLGESYFLLPYVFSCCFIWCSDTWFCGRTNMETNSRLTPGQAYQLSFQGLESLTQLPQPDARPRCGRSSAL